MTTRKVTTIIDDTPFTWEVGGDFSLGEGAPLYDAASDKLHPVLGEVGYAVIPLPNGVAETTHAAICSFLSEMDIPPDLENYHQHVDDALHREVISRSRKMGEYLQIDEESLCAALGEQLGVALGTYIPEAEGIENSGAHIRFNRPGSTDFNPPHRDGALAMYRNILNLWIPIAGCTEQTALPLTAGSHLWNESDCLQTQPGNATINGNTYSVPALIQHRGEDVSMRRTSARFGEVLLFTPYMLHGAAVNQSSHSRISMELRFRVTEQNYPAR